MKTLVIPETVSEIAESALKGCTALESITIPFVGVTATGTTSAHFGSMFDSANYGQQGKNLPESLTTVVISKPCTRLNGGDFRGCEHLTSITLPDTLTSIGDNAFANCTGLESITIPEGVKYLGYSVFYQCENLINVSLPDSLISANGNIFAGCTKLHYNYFYNANYLGNTDNPYVVFAKLEDNSFSSYTINNKTRIIGANAFYGAPSLTTVVIPNSVRSIGKSAFEYCGKLTSVTIPDTVTAIGNGAFVRCSLLASITLPGSITKIEEDLFLDCKALKTINFGGTKAEWNALEKGRNWNYDVPATEVTCSDGTVAIA